MASNKSNIICNYASVFICGLSGIVLTLVIGSHYGPDVLGAFNIVFAIYIILSQIAAFGVHLSVLKYVSESAHDVNLRRSIILSGLAGTVPLAFGVSIFLFLFRHPISALMNSPALIVGLEWASVGLFFFTLNKVLLAALNALSRLKEYALYMAMRHVFMTSTLLVLIALRQGEEFVAFVLPAAEGTLFFLMFFELIKEMRWGGLLVMRELTVKHIHFGFRGLGGNLLLDLNTRVDILCLGLLTNSRVVGIYSMAAMLAEAMYQLPLVMRTVYNPRLIQMLANSAYPQLQALIRETRVLVWSGMAVIALLGVILYPHLIPLVSGNSEYADGTIIFGVIMVGVLIASGYVPFGMLLINAGHPGRQTRMIFLLFMLNVCGNLLLIPLLGDLGAALATAATHVFSVFLLRKLVKRYLKIRI